MSDDDELEIRVRFTLIDDARQICQSQINSCSAGRNKTHSTRLAARASMFSVSKAFVGSSRARIPQFWPNESDKARRIMIDANIFWPAEHRPRMSISTWSLVITT